MLNQKQANRLAAICCASYVICCGICVYDMFAANVPPTKQEMIIRISWFVISLMGIILSLILYDPRKK